MSTRLHELLKNTNGYSMIVKHVPGGIDISSPLPRNPISDIMHSAETLSDDPNGAKKKALALSALTAAGAGAALYYKTHPAIAAASAAAKMANPSMAMLGLLGTAGLYYAKRNWPDNKPKAIAAGAGSIGARAVSKVLDRVEQVKNGVNPAISKLPTDLALKSGLASMAMFGGFTSAADAFQQVEDAEKLKAIADDPKLTPKQREYQRSMITERKDLLTRYPVLRYAPWSDKLRALYNEHYYPAPRGRRGASDFIRAKIR